MSNGALGTVSRYAYVAAPIIFILLSCLLWITAPTIDAHFELDSYSYQRVAEFFCRYWQLRDPIALDQMPVYPLGYTAFMGLIYTMFGQSVYVVIVAQLLLSILSMILAFRIAREIFSQSIAYYTLYALAVHVGILVYGQLIMSEVLVMTLSMGMFERLVQFQKAHSDRYLYQAALLLGLSLVVKTIAIAWVPFFLIYAMYADHASRSIVRILLTVVFCGAPACMFALYNYTQYGLFCISPQFQVNMYHYFLPKLIARVEHISELAARDLIPQDPHNPLASELLHHYVSTDPFGCLVIWVINIAKTWCGLFTTQLKILLNPTLKGGACCYARISDIGPVSVYGYIAYGASSWWVIVVGMLEFLVLIVRTIFLVLGVFCVQRAYRNLALLMTFFVVLCLGMTGFDGCFRFRMVYEPLLVMCAVAGFVYAICAFDRWYNIHVAGARS